MVKVLIKVDDSYPVNLKIIRKSVVETIRGNKLKGDVEVSVSVVSQKKMHALCLKYLKDKNDHEVLSFGFDDFGNSPDGILRLGDVVLCWPEVVLAAKRDGVMVDHEVYQLTAHGVEHLLGKRHE